MAVKVTETAAREIQSIINAQELDAEAIRLRVGVKGGGCSGFSYLLDLTETQRESDELWEFEFDLAPIAADGDEATKSAEAAGGETTDTAVAQATGGPFLLRVICDPKSYLYLNGTEIDFKDELMGRGFVFNNPNATSTCGCGSSFSA
ncbi:MAG: HesB/IscA family protein [Planctomycetota bacterium]|jgi:iron-sulfur cluster assembly protein